LFVGEYRPTYRQPRLKLYHQLRRQLNPALNLKLDLDVNPSLNRASFATLCQKTLRSLFALSIAIEN